MAEPLVMGVLLGNEKGSCSVAQTEPWIGTAMDQGTDSSTARAWHGSGLRFLLSLPPEDGFA